MKPSKKHSVSINGEIYTDYKEFFLRKRDPKEIIKSKLSSGCGDYAFSFHSLANDTNIENKIIDAVQLSNRSLISNFSGHMVIAVYDEANKKWILVDSSSKKIINYNWQEKSNTFKAFSSEFWIGYRGDYKKYPAKNEDELKSFYDTTLKSIPLEIFNEKIIKLKLITNDANIITNKIQFKKIRQINNWLKNAYQKYDLNLNKYMEIEIIREDNEKIKIYKNFKDRWICEIGEKNQLNLSLLDKIEAEIRISNSKN